MNKLACLKIEILNRNAQETVSTYAQLIERTVHK